jgi:hypothetical protein
MAEDPAPSARRRFQTLQPGGTDPQVQGTLIASVIEPEDAAFDACKLH